MRKVVLLGIIAALSLFSTTVFCSTYGEDLPQLRGAKYVKEINIENLIENTRNLPADSPALLFIGASWCPHCRAFKPTYNIVADEINLKTSGLKPKCLYYEAKQDKDEIAKRFKLSGYPTILLFKRNKVYKYDGPRESPPLLEWLDNHNEITGEPYPDFIPGFIDELGDAVRELIKNMKASYKKDPTTMVYFFGGVGVVLLIFAIMFIYAILNSLFGPTKREPGSKVAAGDVEESEKEKDD